jgi:hypothetical protein
MNRKSILALAMIIGLGYAITRVPKTFSAPPAPQVVTINSGTVVSIRLKQSLGSAISVSGQRFAGTLAEPVIVNGQSLLPAGTPVFGRVESATPAGHLAGGAGLRLTLKTISIGDHNIPLITNTVARGTAGQGKRTAKMVGAGAGIGALIGVLAHGRRGAMIGAAAGAGAGAVGAGATNHAPNIVLPAESLVNFRLAQPLRLTAVSSSGRA